MITVKRGVTPKHLVIMAAAANVAEQLGVTVTVTSGDDGQHRPHSKHYTGEALDIRLLGTRTPRFMELIRQRLGVGYQVILEVDHVHVEYDPD